MYIKKSFFDNYKDVDKSVVIKALSELVGIEKEHFFAIWGENPTKKENSVTAYKIISHIDRKIFKTTLKSKLEIFDDDKIQELMLKISPLERERLLKQYSLKSRELKEPLDDLTRKSNSRTISKLIGKQRKNDKSNVSYKPFYEVLEGYTEEEILEDLSHMSDEDKLLIYKKYGTGLDSITFNSDITDEENQKINSQILLGIKRRIDKIRTGKYTYIKISDFIKGLNYDQIRENAEGLNKETKEKLLYYFGDDLKREPLVRKEIIRGILSEDAIKKLCGIKERRRHDIKMISKTMKAAKMETESDLEFLERIKRTIKVIFSEDELKLFYKKYGENLDKTKNIGDYSKKDSYYLTHILSERLERQLMIEAGKRERSKTKKFFDRFPEFSQKEVLGVFKYLKKEDVDSIREIFGEDLQKTYYYREASIETTQEIKRLTHKIRKLLLREISKNINISVRKQLIINHLKRVPEYKDLCGEYGEDIALAVLMKREIPSLTNKELIVMTGITMKDLEELYTGNPKLSLKAGDKVEI